MSRFAAFLCVIALMRPMLIMEAWAKAHRRHYRADRDNAKETRRRFKRRRKLAFLYAMLSIPIVAAPLALVKSTDAQIVGFFAVLGVALEVFLIVYRCPICYKVPADADGLDLDPPTCEGCGAPLTGD